MSENVCVDSRHSEDIPFREKFNIRQCNMIEKVSCQSKSKGTTWIEMSLQTVGEILYQDCETK